jgi:uncharacterized protein involved in exopolysaccharide biosynthesis
MTDQSDWGPGGAIQAGSGIPPIRSRLGLADFLVYGWRVKGLALLLLGSILTLGWLLAQSAPHQYESRSALYLGPVAAGAMDSGAGSASAGPWHATLQGEAEIFRTSLVATRTLSRFPLSRIYPDLETAQARALARADASEHTAIEEAYFQRGVVRLQRNLSVRAQPGSNLISVSFTHSDASVAAEILNAAMATYLNRRTELFGRAPVDQIGQARKAREADLLTADAEIGQFLRDNDIRDFVSEHSTAQNLFTLISGQLVTIQARERAVQAQLSRTREQMAATPSDQDVYVGDPGKQRLSELEIERNLALATYTPQSQRVQAIDRQIAELRSYLADRAATADNAPRAPNPTYQALQATRYQLEAETEALGRERQELQRQLAAVNTKIDRFGGLVPAWQALQRTRERAEASLRAVAEQSARQDPATAILSRQASDVKITEPATVPITGRSLKGVIVLVSFLCALFGLVLLLLWRGATAIGFATPMALQRTMKLPVLAAVRRA